MKTYVDWNPYTATGPDPNPEIWEEEIESRVEALMSDAEWIAAQLQEGNVYSRELARAVAAPYKPGAAYHAIIGGEIVDVLLKLARMQAEYDADNNAYEDYSRGARV